MRAVLFDTETTDLVSNSLLPLEEQPYIVEFYAMTLELSGEEWKKVDEFETFVKPPVPVTETTTKITGITPEDVRDAPRWSEIVVRAHQILQNAEIVVAHNLSFDMAMIEFEAERAEMGAPEWPDWKICTVEATEYFESHRLKLADLHQNLFGEKFTGAHRARTDVEAMGRCFVELWKRKVI